MVARSNIASTRVKPEVSELLQLEVLRSERLSPHFMRVTLGRGDLGRFRCLGFDQWFRLFIPVSPDSLSRAPQKLTTMSYVKYLTVSKSSRPLLRNYTVRAYRPDGADGPELDVDFVLHESMDDTGGPAMTWAQSCRAGDRVAIIDEGIGFNPPPSVNRFVLVADESGLPAVAGILASLPSDAVGQVVVEIPSDADRQSLECPAAVVVTWVARDDEAAVPGRKALAAATLLPVPAEPFYGWAVGESALPVAMRRHWVAAGVPKENIMFCGYWKSAHKS
jgi:NADPH-dependent ferric siderophore reductase